MELSNLEAQMPQYPVFQATFNTLITTTEAAQILKLAEGTIKNKCATGELLAKKVGKQWILDERYLLPTRKAAVWTAPTGAAYLIDGASLNEYIIPKIERKSYFELNLPYFKAKLGNEITFEEIDEDFWKEFEREFEMNLENAVLLEDFTKEYASEEGFYPIEDKSEADILLACPVFNGSTYSYMYMWAHDMESIEVGLLISDYSVPVVHYDSKYTTYLRVCRVLASKEEFISDRFIVIQEKNMTHSKRLVVYVGTFKEVVDYIALLEDKERDIAYYAAEIATL